MRRAVWSQPAERVLEAYLDWIAERDLAAAQRIRQEVLTWVDRTAGHLLGRRSELPGYIVNSLPRRQKIIIYRVSADRIEIVAFRDTRQDPASLVLPPSTE